MTTPDNESMVMAVARAIYEKRNGPGCTPWSRQRKSHREPYISDAIAALEMLRSYTVVIRTEGQVVHELRGAPDDIWKELLTAALSHHNKTE